MWVCGVIMFLGMWWHVACGKCRVVAYVFEEDSCRKDTRDGSLSFVVRSSFFAGSRTSEGRGNKLFVAG
mgnify:CR=1 FL=1